MADVFVYVGPSGFGLPDAILRSDHHVLLPPVRRGDIDRLLHDRAGTAHSEPGVIVVCDGVFHAAPAVSHAELCRAIDGGWDVWGTSSIGAIRAHELRLDGMRGFGHVHALFERDPALTDDEMCLLHLPEAPYFPASEALVNVRFAFETMGPTLGISGRSSGRVIRALRSLWFGDRTTERIRTTMIDSDIAVTITDRLLDWLEVNRVKTIDLARILVDRPWSA